MKKDCQNIFIWHIVLKPPWNINICEKGPWIRYIIWELRHFKVLNLQKIYTLTILAASYFLHASAHMRIDASHASGVACHACGVAPQCNSASYALYLYPSSFAPIFCPCNATVLLSPSPPCMRSQEWAWDAVGPTLQFCFKSRKCQLPRFYHRCLLPWLNTQGCWGVHSGWDADSNAGGFLNMQVV